MSGIAGLYDLEGRPVEERRLTPMLRRLAHRGAGASGTWTSEAVGLGHRLRHATPAAPFCEHRPLTDASGRLALVADARIDNRPALARAFGWETPRAEAAPDAAFILAAYERWGVDCPARLVGAFAFALWDRRRRHFFCARDHLGLRPFYYHAAPGRFAFASEMKALLCLSEVPDRLDEARVADYLMGMTEDKEATFYKAIRRLPPACSLTVTPGGLARRRYWTLDPQRTVHFDTDAEYAEAYRERFVEAVRCRLRSDAPVGSLLSGGLDSSAVTCAARSLMEAESRGSLNTFSLVFDDVPESDERPYIEAVLAQGGTAPHFVRGDDADPLADLDRMLWHTEEPFFTPNLFLNWQLLRRAQQEGAGVLLDGFLGDNVVSHGSRYLTELAATGRWLALGREVQAVARLMGRPRSAVVPRLLRRFAFAPLVAEPVQRAWNQISRPELPGHLPGWCISGDLARRTNWMGRARAFGQDAPRTPRRARDEHHAELTSGTLPGALEIAGKAAAAFGIEPRFPFADRRLVELCLAVPATQKYRDGWTRSIARRGLEPYLPEKVHARHGKASLHPVFVRSLLTVAREPLSTLIFDQLSIAADYVDVPAVQRAYRQLLRDPESSDALLPIWRVAILARWLSLKHSGRSDEAPAGTASRERALRAV